MLLHAPLRSRLALLAASLALVLALLVPPISSAGASQDTPPQPPYASGEVSISYQPGAGPVSAVNRQPGRPSPDSTDPSWQAASAEISRATGLEILSARPDHGLARLRVKAGDEAAEIERLQSLPWVRHAELNYYAYAAGAAAGAPAAGPVAESAPDAGTVAPFYPNDPDFGKQWNMHRVKAPDAWAATRGSSSFVVAVLDTGVAQSHPDFAGQLLAGYNYVTDQPGAEDDDALSHGTHVTGILAAATNNGVGVAGLAPNIKILPLKVLNEYEAGRYDAIAAAIRDAADRQAQVINMSLTGLASSSILQDAINYAQGEGSLIVAAAGNCAQNPGYCGGQINPVVYPAAYPGVLAVGASDRFDRVTTYSGYKPYIGLAAPGGTEAEPVWSTANPKNSPYYASYRSMYGTSMSTPMVSAAAALAWTLRPAATPDEVADILKSTADKVGTDPYTGESLSYATGRNDYFGSGRLNVENAVRWAYPPSISAASGDVSLRLGGAATSVTQTVEIANPSTQAVYWTASLVSGSPWLSLPAANGTSLYGTPAQLTLRADRLNLSPGIYVGIIRVESIYPTGLDPVDIRVQMRVSATLTRSYLPVLAQNPEPTWLDPNSPSNLYRSVLPLGNDSLVTIALPFPVRYYGASYQTLQVSDNGLVLLGLASGAPAQAPAACPGDGRAPNNAVYVLASDWNPSLGGQVVVHEPDAQSYVITWQEVRRAGSSLSQSFQIVIQSNGSIRGNYRVVEAPLPGIIGAENYDGAFSQQVLCNGAGRQVKSGESVSFDTQLPW